MMAIYLSQGGRFDPWLVLFSVAALIVYVVVGSLVEWIRGRKKP